MNLPVFVWLFIVIGFAVVFNYAVTCVTKSELEYIDYVYYANAMLIDAICDYNKWCIQNHLESSLMDYKDIMDYIKACNMYPDPISWRDLISEDKLELLKPYLPEDPDTYIYNKVKNGGGI